MKISVIVPMYNREKYIRECVESLIGQTYPREELELIFVDDGSTDGTVDIVKEYEARFPDNIMIVELPQNSGGRPGLVRNIGMGYAGGDYIMFVDSDDVVDPAIIERMAALQNRYGADIVSANMQMFAQDQILFTETKDDRFFDTPSNGQDFVDLLASEGSDGHIGARLYKRVFLSEHDITFPEDRHVSEDTAFNMLCLLSRPRYCRTSDILYFYRNNAEGLWRSDDQDPDRIMDCMRTQAELYPLYKRELSGIMEVAEWFYCMALDNAKKRLFNMGRSDYYYERLPGFQRQAKEFFPQLSKNKLILGQLDDSGVKQTLMDLLSLGEVKRVDSDLITVDIVSPLGGNIGGVENAILKWTRCIDHDKINLRVFHCERGGLYLQGYEKQYSIDAEMPEPPDAYYLAEAYTAFIRSHGAPDICIATNWPIMVTACDIVRKRQGLHNMKLISWIHNTISTYEEAGLGGASEIVAADAHFAISHQMGEDIRKADPDALIYEVGNPVDMRELSTVEVDPYMLTFVGRLSYIKHVDIILEAMYRAKSKKWKLRIIGDGEIKKEVKGWIKLLKLESRVRMIGWCEDPWRECADSQYLVMASEYEGFPMTACEAASLGKTIISTPVQGVVDYLVPGVTGYLYPHEDAIALADILNNLERKKLTPGDPAECRRSVERYATEKYFKNVTDAMYEVLGR